MARKFLQMWLRLPLILKVNGQQAQLTLTQKKKGKKSGKRKKKTLTDKAQLEAHAQCVDILNAMDSKARKKLCKFYISSES